jgi:hypothetical protein
MMNEFETVVVVATLILAVCATVDMPPTRSHAGAASSDKAYMATPLVECCVRQRTDNPMNPADDGRNDRSAAE